MRTSPVTIYKQQIAEQNRENAHLRERLAPRKTTPRCSI